jgi:hypothetical protein
MKKAVRIPRKTVRMTMITFTGAMNHHESFAESSVYSEPSTNEEKIGRAHV